MRNPRDCAMHLLSTRFKEKLKNAIRFIIYKSMLMNQNGLLFTIIYSCIFRIMLTFL